MTYFATGMKGDTLNFRLKIGRENLVFEDVKHIIITCTKCNIEDSSGKIIYDWKKHKDINKLVDCLDELDKSIELNITIVEKTIKDVKCVGSKEELSAMLRELRKVKSKIYDNSDLDDTIRKALNRGK